MESPAECAERLNPPHLNEEKVAGVLDGEHELCIEPKRIQILPLSFGSFAPLPSADPAHDAGPRIL